MGTTVWTTKDLISNIITRLSGIGVPVAFTKSISIPIYSCISDLEKIVEAISQQETPVENQNGSEMSNDPEHDNPTG